jgi:D-arabinose 1-dehydrogenase-like Zn-dependent alcohol dehydrogenase
MKTKTGRAAVYVRANAPLELRRYPVLPPERHQALLKLVMSGICGTDIHILEGRLPIPPPFIPGHEFIGQVEALGAGVKTDGLGAPLKAGDAVIACVALPCGGCFCCKQGETASCLNFGVSNIKDAGVAPHFFGGFGEYLHQPAKTLVKIPKGVDPKAVAAMPCAGPTIIRALDFAGNLNGNELVVVQGTGPVGLFAVAYAAAAGCTVLAIGSRAHRLKAARTLGAKAVLDYRKTSIDQRSQTVQDWAKRLGRGNGADVVIEASGSPAAIPEGLQLLRTLGRYVVPGQYSSSGTVAIQPEWITFKALKIIGSGQYKLHDIAIYLDFLKRHPQTARAFARMVTPFRVGDAARAVRAVSSGKVVKGALVP